MSRRARRAPWAIAITVTAGLFISTGPAHAATGTWGTGHWPYRNGVVCELAGVSVPLVGWQLDGVSAPGFLTAGISESAGVDTGRPSIAVSGSALDSLLQAGTFSSAQLAALAYLTTAWGADASAARVAEVSEIVAEQAGAPRGGQCLATGQGATSSAEAQTMWTRAQQLAGPYQVTLTSTAARLALQVPIPVRANVTSALGYPVPGFTVRFGSTGVSVGATAVTDATGTASASVVVATPSSVAGAPPLALTATVNAPLGLRIRGTPGAVPAVYSDTAVPTTATLNIGLAPPTDPTVAVTPSSRLARPGTLIGTTISTTGLNGHPGTAAVTIAGPLPADDTGSCANQSAASWIAALAAASGPSLILGRATVPVAGGASTLGPSFTAAKPGCYATSTVLATTDASPSVTVTAPWTVAVTVVALTVSAQAAPGGVNLAGTLPATVTVTAATHLSGSTSGVVRGPVPADTGSCAAVRWDAAPIAAAIAASPVTGAGATALPITRLGYPGCYALDLNLTLAVGSLGSLTVHLPAGTPGTVALLVAPTVQLAAQTTWIDAGERVQATITVLGTLTQPGTLTSALMWRPSTPLGCASLDWAHATSVGPGQSAPTSGDGTYPMVSAKAAKTGCYSMVATLTLLANADVVVAGPAGSAASLVLAVQSASGPAPLVRGRPVDDTLATWLTLSGFAALLGAAFAASAAVGWRTRLP